MLGWIQWASRPQLKNAVAVVKTVGHGIIKDEQEIHRMAIFAARILLWVMLKDSMMQGQL